MDNRCISCQELQRWKGRGRRRDIIVFVDNVFPSFETKRRDWKSQVEIPGFFHIRVLWLRACQIRMSNRIFIKNLPWWWSFVLSWTPSNGNVSERSIFSPISSACLCKNTLAGRGYYYCSNKILYLLNCTWDSSRLDLSVASSFLMKNLGMYFSLSLPLTVSLTPMYPRSSRRQWN